MDVLMTLAEPVVVPAADLEQRPHSIFRQYRPIAPIIKRDDGIYVAMRAADIEWLTSDPRTRQLETEFVRSRGVSEGPLFDFINNTMLLTNGPAHRRRRAPLSRAFAFKLITDLRPRIRAIADELIDRSYAKGEMNFMDDFATWMPARVISEILGLPEADIPHFTRQVYSLARSLSSGLTHEMVPELDEAAYELTQYAHRLIEERRTEPRDDLLSSYVSAIDESESLSRIEALTQIVTVVLAGSDTTRGAMAIQTSLLLQHREQWDAVCKDPTLIPGAVAESLRFEPSVGSFVRITLEDIEIGGYTVPRQSLLALSNISAMRDPALYANPDQFDITRTDHPRKHLVFGGGVHRCLGEVLAKVELEEALAAVTARLPGLELAGDLPKVHGSGGIRKVMNMQVRWATH
jgi:cytochrome P450